MRSYKVNVAFRWGRPNMISLQDCSLLGDRRRCSHSSGVYLEYPGSDSNWWAWSSLVVDGDKGFLICEYSEMGAKEVEMEVIAAPSNGESLSFCLGITLLHGG